MLLLLLLCLVVVVLQVVVVVGWWWWWWDGGGGGRCCYADALTKQLGKHDFMLWREILLNGGMLDGGARVSTTTNAKGE